MRNAIKKKILFYVDVTFLSPVSVSNGNEDKTDGDVLRDYEGKPFIAGSSLAGAMRNYLNYDKNEPCIFGYQGRENSGKMSSLFLSDLTFTSEIKITVRDGIGLNENKTVQEGKKFDLEAIDSGASGQFVMELVVREKDDEADMMQQIYQVLYGIHTGEIRLGNKKTRGYGEMALTAVRKKEYDKENILEYKEAYHLEKVYKELSDCKVECLEKGKKDSRYVKMQVPLKLTGGISIRQYSSKKHEPDMVHITANGFPVVTGTSFAGAMRSRMKTFVKMLCPKYTNTQIDRLMAGMWGCIDEEVPGEAGRASHIIVAESVIEGGTPVTTVRTGVSRFESAAKNGALREERMYAEGNVVLRMKILRDEAADWTIGLLLLVIKELQNGYLPVGGQTAVGRGIFEANGSIIIDGEEADEQKYLNKLRKKLEEDVLC